jgi:aspartate beta-hydroxylase
MASADIDALIQRALHADALGQTRDAERWCLQALERAPGHVEGSLLAARYAVARRDLARAASVLQPALDQHPGHAELSIQLALALAATGQTESAVQILHRLVEIDPAAHHAWLLIGAMKERLGDGLGALKAGHQAISRAQRAGQWLDEASTPSDLLPLVMRTVERVRAGRRELFLDAYAPLRAEYGAEALRRMDRALACYLGQLAVAPSSPYQRPRFFYFPELGDSPYHDPYLQPWAGQLREAFPAIRAEALTVLDEGPQALPDFITQDRLRGQPSHLGGTARQPTWQAYFFFRRGQRFDANHERCPQTSSVLESLDLCRIAGQAPEICFSVLRPQTHIKPHHGVTNTRLVMHLPLIVPPDCALEVHGGGVRAWAEGELLMFDDTYLHEAWNRSDATRVILLMDCWNPHLTLVERLAYGRLVEVISSLKPD